MKINVSFILQILPIIISLFLAGAIFLYLNKLPNRLPLFYSLAWGENQLIFKQQLFVIPAIISSISLINLLILWHTKELLLKRVLLFSSLITTVILSISVLKIIYIFI